MAIAFGSSAQGVGSGVNVFDIALTVTGSNVTVVCGVNEQDAGAPPASVTWNGVSLTQIKTSSGGGSNSIWALANASTGTHNIEVTRAFGHTAGDCSAAASYYTGTDSSQPDSSNNGTTSTSPLTLSDTVVATGCWLVAWATVHETLVSTWTSNFTDRQSINQGSLGATINDLSDTNGTVSTGSQSIVFTANHFSLNSCGGVILALAPFVFTSSVKKASGVSQASISKVSSVTNANARKIAGVQNQP